MTLADLITTYLTTNGMSQGEFARRSGLSHPYVNALANDKRKPRKWEHITALATMLGVSTDEVYAAMSKIPPDIQSWIEADPNHLHQVRQLMPPTE